MMPEIFEDTGGRIVGVIVALTNGSYEASIKTNLHDCSEESLILQKMFVQLKEARYWVKMNTLIEIVEAA